MSDASKIKESWDESSGDETTQSSTTSPAHNSNDTTKNEPNTKVTRTQDPSMESLDTIEPETEQQFKQFSKLLNQKITGFNKSPLYITFLSSLMKDICSNLDVETVRRVSANLEALSVEKGKLNKAKTKGKKKSKRVGLNAGKNQSLMDFGDENEDTYDFDDM